MVPSLSEPGCFVLALPIRRASIAALSPTHFLPRGRVRAYGHHLPYFTSMDSIIGHQHTMYVHSCINICTQKGHLHNIHFQLCTASHTLTSPIYICTPHLPNIATLAPGRGATTATKVTCLFAILFIFFALVYLWFFILAHISSLEFAWNPSESFNCLFVF